jgi:hypothetical protein
MPKPEKTGPLEAGNIDLLHRPIAKNDDGSISTVRSMSFGEGGKEILVPTVSPEGKLLSEDEAIDLYHKTGAHLGKFATPESATAYAEQLHKDQEKTYAKQEAEWAREHASQQASREAPNAAAGAHTVQLVDRDGNLHDVPAEQAAGAVRSGKYGWNAGSTIVGIDPATGLPKDIPAEQASAFLKQGGRLASAAEAADAALQKEYGGIGGGLAAAGEGAARGLTAGLSDPLAVGAARLLGGEHAAEKVRGHLSGIQSANPGISMGSEIVGAVAPMFVGDELGLGSILGTIPRGIGAGGEMAAQVAAKLVGTSAEKLLSRAGQKAIRSATQAMVEGGLWGAGQEVSSATLANRDLTAESFISAAGHGALLAGAIGGALGAAEPVFGKALSAFGEHAPFEEKIANAADEQYIRALSPKNQGIIKEMKERFGGTDAPKRIADRLRTEGIVSAGDNIEKIAAKAAKAESSAIDGLSEMVDKVGAKGVRVEDALQALEARAKQFESHLGFASAAGEIRSKIKEIADIYGPRAMAAPEMAGREIGEYEIPIREMLDQRRGLERTINWNTDTVRAQGIKAAGRTIEDTIMRAGENAAKEAGNTSWLADYQAAKTRFSEIRFINETAEGALTAKLRNRLASPSDMAAGLMGMNLGEHVGEAAGHGIAGGIGGMLLGAAHHQIRQRGNATLAVLLDKLGTLGGMSEAHAGSMARLDSTIKSALSSSPAKVIPIAKKDYSQARFNKEAERVMAMNAAPERVAAHMQKQTASLTSHAPEIAEAVNQKSVAAVKYLGTKLPASFTGAKAEPTWTPNVKKSASGPEMVTFLKAKDAVEAGPEDIFRDVMRGHGGLVEADVMKNVYPAYFAEAQQRVQLECASRIHPVPYQTAIRLGILFDVPTTASLQADLIQQAQMIYAPKPSTGGPGAPGGKSRGSTQKPLKLATMTSGMFEPAGDLGGAKK